MAEALCGDCQQCMACGECRCFADVAPGGDDSPDSDDLRVFTFLSEQDSTDGTEAVPPPLGNRITALPADAAVHVAAILAECDLFQTSLLDVLSALESRWHLASGALSEFKEQIKPLIVTAKGKGKGMT